MKYSLSNEIKEKAYFVAGQNAWFRDDNDPNVRSAVNDAETLLIQIPEDIAQPMISGGNTTNPDPIIMLTWLVAGYENIKLVSVSFTGNNRCNVFWDEPNGNHELMEDISTDVLEKLDIAGKIRNLTDGAASQYFNAPPKPDI